jgi:hypothetical protein
MVMEIGVKIKKEIKHPIINVKSGDFFWFFFFVALPFISLIYSIGEFLYKN